MHSLAARAAVAASAAVQQAPATLGPILATHSTLVYAIALALVGTAAVALVALFAAGVIVVLVVRSGRSPVLPTTVAQPLASLADDDFETLK